ncbi:MAG: rhomboid family intramembrane serine protease [Deltaproteobacteria bacterium]|nr:rhomboid family intramembrane serine protease [Deltaproteobacteria bacterium]
MIPYRSSQKRKGYATRTFPWVTVALILMNVAVFFYEVTLPAAQLKDFFKTFALVPGHFRPLGLITGLFLHGGWLHLIANMLYLWVFGDNVEEKMGRHSFLNFYLASGIISFLAQVAFDPGSSLPLIGASGAIAGILGIYLRLFPKSHVTVLVPIFIFLRRMILPAWLVLGFWFVLQLLEGLLSLQQLEAGAASSGGIAFFAHIGGFLFGILVGPLFVKRKKRG